ncbi:EamA family transporter [Patescibacteria group bacterium]|nr:EamA family transporter [Patescibacteria group bacterium]MBU1868295.1 EamA family transporter [Patescibacteria group bacterium]
MLYIMIFASVIIGVVGQLLMKQGVSQLGEVAGGAIPFLLKAVFSPWVIAGLFGYGVGTLLWLLILSKADVSYAYPMLSLGYIFLLIFASIFLGEQITLVRVAGVLLIVVGVILITRS